MPAALWNRLQIRIPTACRPRPSETIQVTKTCGRIGCKRGRKQGGRHCGPLVAWRAGPDFGADRSPLMRRPYRRHTRSGNLQPAGRSTDFPAGIDGTGTPPLAWKLKRGTIKGTLPCLRSCRRRRRNPQKRSPQKTPPGHEQQQEDRDGQKPNSTGPVISAIYARFSRPIEPLGQSQGRCFRHRRHTLTPSRGIDPLGFRRATAGDGG